MGSLVKLYEAVKDEKGALATVWMPEHPIYMCGFIILYHDRVFQLRVCANLASRASKLLHKCLLVETSHF